MFLQFESDTGSPVSIQLEQIQQVRPSRDDVKLSVIHLATTSITVKMPYAELMQKLSL